ncbi:MAG: hypothetical protein GKS00_25655 [Alphaproteobacteria bacterium]|nr:hypothetical protein [Alphaproteobacteria bacterium]
MRNLLRLLVIFFIITGTTHSAIADALPLPEPTTSERFKVGQVWTYKTRTVETGSRVIIGKIEKIPQIGTVVHVKLVGLHLKNPLADGGYGSVIQHLPVSEAALLDSVVARTSDVADLTGFSDGYETWLSAYRNEGAGVFTGPLAEIADMMEQVINSQRKRKS